MFTPDEKKMLIELLNSLQITGTRKTILATMEKVDRLAAKIEAMPVEEPPATQEKTE